MERREERLGKGWEARSGWASGINVWLPPGLGERVEMAVGSWTGPDSEFQDPDWATEWDPSPRPRARGLTQKTPTTMWTPSLRSSSPLLTAGSPGHSLSAPTALPQSGWLGQS